MRNHVLPELGRYQVTELDRSLVRLWGPAGWPDAAWVLAQGANPVPAGLVKKPPRKEWTSLTDRDVEAVASAIRPDMTAIVRTEAWFGGRVSEILSLRTEDITFTGKEAGEPLGPQLDRLVALPEDKFSARNVTLRFGRKFEVGRVPGDIKSARGNRTLPLAQWLSPVQQADMARPAGVDVTTVSRAFSGRPYGLGISDTTRVRVKEAAARLGYSYRRPFSYETYRGVFRAGLLLAQYEELCADPGPFASG